MRVYKWLICCMFLSAAVPLLSKNELLLMDLDDDNIQDSIVWDEEQLIIICKLSSQNFEPINSKEMSGYADRSGLSGEGKDCFFFYNSWMRTREDYEFRYEKEEKRIRLIEMSLETSGNAANDGAGSASVNLLTNKYIGNFRYYDPQNGELKKNSKQSRDIATSYPKIYLEDFSDKDYFVDIEP